MTKNLFLKWMLPTLLVLPPAMSAQAAGKDAATKKVQKPKTAAAQPSETKNIAHPRLERDPVITQVMKDVSPERIQKTIEKLVSFGTRSTLSVNNPGAAASDRGIVAARNWIKSEFERYSADCGGCLSVMTDTFIEKPRNPSEAAKDLPEGSTDTSDRIKEPTELQNVYAILRGSDPAQASRIYLVTGHYDSRNSDNFNSTDAAPGANDDGSGTAVSLECARVLSKHRFPATLIFLTVAGEEQGLRGSGHFAKMVKAEQWKLEGVLNNDIVGGNHTPGDTKQNPNWVRVFSEGLPAVASEAQLRAIRSMGSENDSTSRQLARYIREVGDTYHFGQFTPKLIFRRDRYLRGGDHSAFNDQGFAAIRFTEYREDYNHQHQNVRMEKGVEYGDLPKFVDFNYVGNVARLNAATLASLAMAPPPPAKVKLLTRVLENDSKIEWEAVPGATAYEVLWRKTTDAEFASENTMRTTETKVDFDQSKDNVIFGVRSIGPKGHRSLVVTPAAERATRAGTPDANR
ncbi:MAG TPA: M28 family peptidase [Candidatus Saccharimonadales bacterium]|nr:M28 family peptidase [Candidatus Saccharimonadales bacterium]